METAAKPSPGEMAQLRAEMRRRKILERGDERMRKLFKESKDESRLSRSESVEERNKSLLDEIKRDPKVMHRLSSIEAESESDLRADSLTNGAIRQSTSNSNTSNHHADHHAGHPANSAISQLDNHSPKLANGPNSLISSTPIETNSTNGQSKGKPTIDLRYFEQLKKKEKQRQEQLTITRFQLLMINLVSLVTLESDTILVSLFKLLIASFSSYIGLNIVTPFIIAESTAFFYTDFLRPNSFGLKLSYTLIKRILLDSLSFFFIYTLVQTFVLDS